MANNFSSDSNGIALYPFESTLTQDSKGSNTLTSSGTPENETGVGFVDEGSGSVKLSSDNTDFFYILDSGLSSNFPLKSGTSNKTISVFVRFRANVTGSDKTNVIVSRSTDTGGIFRTWYCSIGVTAGGVATFSQRIGKLDGTFFEEVSHPTTVSDIGTHFYRIVWSYQDSDKTYAIRIRDDSGNVVGTDFTGTSGTDGISLFSNSDFMIGARGDHTSAVFYTTGWLDELVIFDKILTATDTTNLANGTYSGSSGSNAPKPLIRGS